MANPDWKPFKLSPAEQKIKDAAKKHKSSLIVPPVPKAKPKKK